MPSVAKILLVEDNPLDQKLFLSIAKKKQYWVGEVRVAENGKQALEMLRASKCTGWLPELVVVDLTMPEMDGLEFLQICRTNSELCNLPILVLTSSDRPQDMLDSYSRQADGFLRKPEGLTGMEDLFRQLRKVWKETRQ